MRTKRFRACVAFAVVCCVVLCSVCLRVPVSVCISRVHRVLHMSALCVCECACACEAGETPRDMMRKGPRSLAALRVVSPRDSLRVSETSPVFMERVNNTIRVKEFQF